MKRSEARRHGAAYILDYLVKQTTPKAELSFRPMRYGMQESCPDSADVQI